MQNYNNEKYIHFHNNTPLPIMIESWVDGSCKMQSIKVEPGEKKLVHSATGEWHLDSMFADIQDINQWSEYFGKNSWGGNKYILVGTFRCKPDYWGKYSIMEHDEPFQCVYSTMKTDHYIRGLITYSLIDATKYIIPLSLSVSRDTH